MSKMNLLQAINHALDIALSSDEKALCLGEVVGHFGSVFSATSLLL